LGGVGRRGGARISAGSRCPMFTRSNNVINGAAEEMTGVGNDLIALPVGTKLRRPPTWRSWVVPVAAVPGLGLVASEHGSRRLSRFNKLFK
jgi:hypothetical protein